MVLRKFAQAATPTVNISNEGDKWKIETITTMKTSLIEFKVNLVLRYLALCYFSVHHNLCNYSTMCMSKVTQTSSYSPTCTFIGSPRNRHDCYC